MIPADIAKIFAQSESRFHDVVERLKRMSIYTDAFCYVVPDTGVRDVYLVFSVYPTRKLVFASIVYPPTPSSPDGDFEDVELPFEAAKKHIAPGNWGEYDELRMKEYLLTFGHI